jgi:hypothetical protein
VVPSSREARSDDKDNGYGIHGKTRKEPISIRLFSVPFRGLRGHKQEILALSLKRTSPRSASAGLIALPPSTSNGMFLPVESTS